MSNRNEDEITPRQLQKRIGCCALTSYNWCKRALDSNDGPLAGYVRRDATGHYHIKSTVLDSLVSN